MLGQAPRHVSPPLIDMGQSLTSAGASAYLAIQSVRNGEPWGMGLFGILGLGWIAKLYSDMTGGPTFADISRNLAITADIVSVASNVLAAVWAYAQAYKEPEIFPWLFAAFAGLNGIKLLSDFSYR